MDPTPGAPPFVFSRESALRIDRDGRLWHEGEPIRHEGLARGLLRWLAVDDATGRYVLRNSMDWCFVTVDDAPLVVHSVRISGDTAELQLSDDTSAPLDASTLRIDEDDVPYCTVRGALPARFDRTAAFVLLSHAQPAGEGFELVLGERRTPLRVVPRGEGARR